MEKVVIVGAGPCGLLLAHYLLRRGNRYQVEIYERLGDPREVVLSNSRTIPYGLKERGFKALRRIDGLEEAIKTECVENWNTIIHKANGKTQLLPRQEPSFNTDRITVVNVLLLSLLEMVKSDRLNLHFNCKCLSVDLQRQTALFEPVSLDANTEKPFLVSYDRLVGADGARSLIRSHLLRTQSFDFEQATSQSCYKTIFLPSKNSETGGDLQQEAFHIWRPEEGINFAALPQVSGGYIGLLFVTRNRQELLNFESPNRVKDFFRQYLPEIGLLVSDAEAEAFMRRPISTQMKIRCSRYHHGERVLLIGDAAHAVSSATGQGCNVAFEDVSIFDRFLDECEDNWELALAKFSEYRKPDARALWEIDGNIFPLSKILFVEFILRERWAKIGNRWFPNLVAPALRDGLNGSSLSYAQILKNHKGWVAKVKASNQKIASRSTLN